MLEEPKPHETNPIPAEFLGVELDAGKADGPATDKEVVYKNTMAAGFSENYIIVHGTPHTDYMEGTAPLPLDDDNNKGIKDVCMPENEPAEITDVDSYNATNGEQ